jgi:hypothetical protein
MVGSNERGKASAKEQKSFERQDKRRKKSGTMGEITDQKSKRQLKGRQRKIEQKEQAQMCVKNIILYPLQM